MAELKLSGPSATPVAGGAPRQLVVLVHGYGADGSDLIGLSPVLGRILPHAAFVAPNAPFPCAGAPTGHQWFDVFDRSDEARLAGTRMAAKYLDPFLDEQLAAHGLTDDKLVLLGFSQGTMMSLHVGLRRKTAPAGILGYSGRLIAPELLTSEITSRPPIQLVHGDADPMVPVQSLPDAVDALKAAGLEVEGHVCQGLGHGIDEEGILVGARFLHRLFPEDIAAND